MFWFKLTVFLMISVVSQVKCSALKTSVPRKPRNHEVAHAPNNRYNPGRLILHDDQGNEYKFWNISYEHTVSINNNNNNNNDNNDDGGGANSTVLANRAPNSTTEKKRRTTTESPTTMDAIVDDILGDPIENDPSDRSPNDEQPSAVITSVARETQTRPSPSPKPTHSSTPNRPNSDRHHGTDKPIVVADNHHQTTLLVESTTPELPNTSGDDVVGGPRWSQTVDPHVTIEWPPIVEDSDAAGIEIDPNEVGRLNGPYETRDGLLLFVENRIKLNFIVDSKKMSAKPSMTLEQDDDDGNRQTTENDERNIVHTKCDEEDENLQGFGREAEKNP